MVRTNKTTRKTTNKKWWTTTELNQRSVLFIIVTKKKKTTTTNRQRKKNNNKIDTLFIRICSISFNAVLFSQQKKKRKENIHWTATHWTAQYNIIYSILSFFFKVYINTHAHTLARSLYRQQRHKIYIHVILLARTTTSLMCFLLNVVVYCVYNNNNNKSTTRYGDEEKRTKLCDYSLSLSPSRSHCWMPFFATVIRDTHTQYEDSMNGFQHQSNPKKKN